MVSNRDLAPLISLTTLAEVRLSSGSRPLAELLVTQPQWILPEITQAGGLEVAGLSFLGNSKQYLLQLLQNLFSAGPFLSPSVFPEEDPGVADQYFSEEPITLYHVKMACTALQPSLDLLRTHLHQVSINDHQDSVDINVFLALFCGTG